MVSRILDRYCGVMTKILCSVVVPIAILPAACGNGADPSGNELGEEHAVIVFIPPPDTELGLDEIEDPLIEAIEEDGTGEFDGNEIGPDGATLFMYGPDADALYATVSGVLSELDLPEGTYAIKRYGPPGAEETRVELN
jgi:hypothetical protein